jgi:hypothetical protein
LSWAVSGPVRAGEPGGVLGLVFELRAADVAELELAGEELDAAAHLGRQRDRADLGLQAVDLRLGEDDLPRHDLLGADVVLDAGAGRRGSAD